MEHNFSKKSYVNSSKIFSETLNRGHQSEITDAKRRTHRAYNASGRRMFTFKGSQNKRPVESRGRSRMRDTPASSVDTSMLKTVSLKSGPVKCRRSTSQAARKARTPATSGLRSRSAVRSRQRATSRKAPSRTASVAGSRSSSRKASFDGTTVAVATAVVDMPPAEGASKNVEVAGVIQEPSPSPDIIKTEESKLVSSPKSSDSELNDDHDEDEGEHIASKSPAIAAYRKLVFNEEQNKWIEYLKMEEDLKQVSERQKRAAAVVKEQSTLVNVRKVKGRSTAKMQVMFPTAIIKQDRGRGFNHINMTDALRIELHKRRAPIVPTFFQEHILKYGKLPFRNNPRPHPIV